MTGGSAPGGAPAPGGPIRPVIALGYAVVGFAALAICGLGMTSLITDTDVIAVPGLGPIPGILGMILATAGFAGALWPFLRAERPPFFGAFAAAAVAMFAYLVGVAIGGLLSGADPAAAAAAAGGVATSWFGLVLAVAAFAAGWAGIALVRTRAHRPRWPWEVDGDE
jgi:hypothetical protein